MKSPEHSVVVSAVLILASVVAGPLHAQESPSSNAPAKVEAEEKPLIQQMAEEVIIPRLEFENADVDECIAYLARKSQGIDSDENPQGVNFRTRAGGQARPVTLSLRDVTVWDAAQKIAAAAGLEASVTDAAIVIHPMGAGQAAEPAPAAHEKSAVWKRAEKIVLDRAQFFASSPADVCAFLKMKSKAADKEGRGVDISAADGVIRAVSLDLRNAKLTDLITAVAEVTGAEITVSGEKIILRPKKVQ